MSLLLASVEHDPPQDFTTPFRDAIAPGKAPQLVETAVLDAPWGQERLSNRPFSSIELGSFKPRMMGLAEAGTAVSPRVHSLASVETSIIVDDADRYLHKLIHQYEHRLPDSPITLATAVKGLPPALWWRYFTGVLDSWPIVPAGRKLVLRTRDLPLRSPFPRRKISVSDRPNIPADSIGRFYQIVYGRHESTGLEVKGPVEGIEVDSVGFVYHFSLGRLGAFRNVYADGVIVPTSDYSVLYPMTNGFRETVIDFVTSKAGKRITADVDGLTTHADGSGRYLDGAGEIFSHWLTNWIFNDWSAELATSYDGWHDPGLVPLALAPIWWTNEFVKREGHKCTLVLGGDTEETDGFAEIESVCRSFHIHPYWDEHGRIALTPINAYAYLLRFSYPWIRGRYDDLDAGFSGVHNTRQKISKIIVNWLPNSSEDSLLQTFEIEDLAVREKSELSLDLPNTAAEI